MNPIKNYQVTSNFKQSRVYILNKCPLLLFPLHSVCTPINSLTLLAILQLSGWLEALAMESRSFGSARPRGGRGKSNFGSRDYRMESRRGDSRGGGGSGRYGNSGGNSGGRINYFNHSENYCKLK